MSERKFTPPTTFPAEYQLGGGHRIVLYAKGKGARPYVGQMKEFDGWDWGQWWCFDEEGSYYHHQLYDIED